MFPKTIKLAALFLITSSSNIALTNQMSSSSTKESCPHPWKEFLTQNKKELASLSCAMARAHIDLKKTFPACKPLKELNFSDVATIAKMSCSIAINAGVGYTGLEYLTTCPQNTRRANTQLSFLEKSRNELEKMGRSFLGTALCFTAIKPLLPEPLENPVTHAVCATASTIAFFDQVRKLNKVRQPEECASIIFKMGSCFVSAFQNWGLFYESCTAHQ